MDLTDVRIFDTSAILSVCVYCWLQCIESRVSSIIDWEIFALLFVHGFFLVI